MENDHNSSFEHGYLILVEQILDNFYKSQMMKNVWQSPNNHESAVFSNLLIIHATEISPREFANLPHDYLFCLLFELHGNVRTSRNNNNGKAWRLVHIR